MTERMIPTRIGRIALTSQGEGPLLVLVPAAGRAAADFSAIVPALALRFRVVALDWPSTGASPAADRPDNATARVFAETLREVVEALGEPGVVLGHSVGGFAAARLALDAPDLVRGLVLVAPFGFFSFGPVTRALCAMKGRTAVTRAIEGYFARAHTIRRTAHTAGMFSRVDNALARPGYAEITAALWRSFPDPDNDLRQAARSIRCPTLVCWGWLDPVIPVICALTAARAVPGAKLALFRTGHTPFVEDTAAFLRKLEPFLAALPAPPARAATHAS
jgi:pimeloyl-ACP methyl ester carboxylesterase